MNTEKNKIYHTGFYKEYPKKKLTDYENYLLNDIPYETDNPYEMADIFLNGSCDIFALYLHNKYGYEIYKLSNRPAIHYFCIDYSKGIKKYIDVRGITTSYEEFICEFPRLKKIDINSAKKVEKLDIEKDIEQNKNDKFLYFGLKFAEDIIENNPKFYCSDDF